MTITEMDAEIATLDRRLAAMRADRAKMADKELLRLAHVYGVDVGIGFYRSLGTNDTTVVPFVPRRPGGRS